jgi:hypothetical protein
VFSQWVEVDCALARLQFAKIPFFASYASDFFREANKGYKSALDECVGDFGINAESFLRVLLIDINRLDLYPPTHSRQGDSPRLVDWVALTSATPPAKILGEATFF